ncbi:hypothetical protein K3495_g12321 [Podosphaera aphanis]|nr:hypothetical protein K3495_g12321 [Podosphaera aphanis]
MRFLALLTSCLFLNSVSQAHQLMPRGGGVNLNYSPIVINGKTVRGFNCNNRVYDALNYKPKILKSCGRTESWFWWLRPRKFIPPPEMKVAGDGPYYSVPLFLEDRPTKERRPRHRDRAIVNKNCDILAVVAVVPKSLNLCDRVRRICDEKFDYYKCSTIYK